VLHGELGRRAGPEIHVRALGRRIAVRADPAPSRVGQASARPRKRISASSARACVRGSGGQQ
jgi:hypothetical protein